MESYHVIGLMSGSSLDGLDIAHCRIDADNGQFTYEILDATTVPFPQKWRLRLEKLVLQNAITYIKTHTFLGHYFGETVAKYIADKGLEDQIDFIASHGQTIFHQPENLFTSQIGDGAAIAMETGFPVVCDFRSSDVALGGQGTPIAPIADTLFFSEYNYWMNLGGIANMSFRVGDHLVAFDITAVNMILNQMAEKVGKDYDKDGELARSGEKNDELFDELNGSWYYDKEYPKSLSGGWVSKVMLPVVKRHKIPVEDKLRTLVEHIAYQTGRTIRQVEEKEGLTITKQDKMLVTGGGAFNKFLIEKLEEHVPMSVVVPDDNTVQFKEALMVALMGVLRVRDEVNCLSSVTGAKADTIGGAIYQGSKKHLKTVL